MSNSLQILEKEAPTLEALLKLNTSANTDVKTIVMQEVEYLNQIALQNPVILECLPITVLQSVKSVLKQNLSFDPGLALVYVKSRNAELVIDGKKQWKKILEVTPSANGLISIARQCGSILDIKNPVVKKDTTGKVIEVEVELLIPSVPQPRWEKRVFDESDFERWRRASHKEKARGWANLKPEYKEGKTPPNDETMNYANPNYTSWRGGIDPEFARAKAIRHGLKKLGTNPHEAKASRIVVPNKVVVDAEKDYEAEEITPTVEYAEVIESTTYTKMPDADNL
jgi:hypothetical protein